MGTMVTKIFERVTNVGQWEHRTIWQVESNGRFSRARRLEENYCKVGTSSLASQPDLGLVQAKEVTVECPSSKSQSIDGLGKILEYKWDKSIAMMRNSLTESKNSKGSWFAAWLLDRISDILVEINAYADQHDGKIEELGILLPQSKEDKGNECFKDAEGLFEHIEKISMGKITPQNIQRLCCRLIRAYRVIHGDIVSDNFWAQLNLRKFPGQHAYKYAQKKMLSEVFAMIAKVLIYSGKRRGNISDLEIPVLGSRNQRFYTSVEQLSADVEQDITSIQTQQSSLRYWYIDRLRAIFAVAENKLTGITLTPKQESDLARKIHALL